MMRQALRTTKLYAASAVSGLTTVDTANRSPLV
jgi:hypothetical protein